MANDPAEEQRQAEQRRQEEQRKLQQEQEQQRRQAEQQPADEQKRAEERRQAEQKQQAERHAEERRQEEEERKAAEERRQEQERRQQQNLSFSRPVDPAYDADKPVTPGSEEERKQQEERERRQAEERRRDPSRSVPGAVTQPDPRRPMARQIEVEKVEKVDDAVDVVARRYSGDYSIRPVQPKAGEPTYMPADDLEPNIQIYDDGKSISNLGLAGAVVGSLEGAGLANVGKVRRVRNVDLRMLPNIDDIFLSSIRERVPFECREGELALVPVDDRPGEWTEAEDSANVTAIDHGTAKAEQQPARMNPPAPEKRI